MREGERDNNNPPPAVTPNAPKPAPLRLSRCSLYYFHASRRLLHNFSAERTKELARTDTLVESCPSDFCS